MSRHTHHVSLKYFFFPLIFGITLGMAFVRHFT